MAEELIRRSQSEAVGLKARLWVNGIGKGGQVIMMDKLSTVKARPTRLAHCEDIFCTVSVLSSYSSQFAHSEKMWGLYSITLT